MDSIKEVVVMDLNSLQRLSIEKKGTGTTLALEEMELEHVKDYKIESSSSGTVELTVKLLVRYP